jgi:hypothetical protein
MNQERVFQILMGPHVSEKAAIVADANNQPRSILSRLQTICHGDVRNCDSRLGLGHYAFGLEDALYELGPKPISFHVSPRRTFRSCRCRFCRD